MRPAELSELFEQLNSLDEHPRVDAKTSRDIGESVMDTICAYANEPGLGGGYLLLGVRECDETNDQKYCVVGIDNPDKLQCDIADQCATRFNRILRPEFVVGTLENKTVVGIFMPEIPAGDKPIFFKKVGLPKGAYRRIGSTNQKCTDDDLLVLYQQGMRRSYDETIVPGTTLADLDEEAITEYRSARAEVDPTAEELKYDNRGLLESLNCIKQEDKEWRPTVAGMILFGSRKALRKFFPMMRLDYIRVPGRVWVEDPNHPFDTIEMRDPLFRMLPRGQAAIMDDIPRAFSFNTEGLKRQEEPRISPRVIREALVNAVMHRSYQIHGPVEVIRYANRLEIRNPGHSLKPVDRLGEPGSQTRNPTIASILHETKYAENKGSGIRVMQQLMDEANLSPPSFDSDREHDQFTATFLMHHFLDKQDIAWLAHFKDANLSDDEARILIHARENGWVNNGICRYYTKLDTLEASGILRRLRDLGLLQQHPHASMTYYTPTPNLLRPELSKIQSEQKIPAHEKTTTLTDFTPAMPGTSQPTNLPTYPPTHQPTMPGPLPTNLRALPTNLRALPTNLLEEIRNLGQRSPPGQVQKIIAELCAIRAFTADELAETLNRNKQWVFRSYLSPMIRDGILEYTLPGNPHHPNQAYRAKKHDVKS